MHMNMNAVLTEPLADLCRLCSDHYILALNYAPMLEISDILVFTVTYDNL